jgi:tetratricopeptide (TPR) repeat protein
VTPGAVLPARELLGEMLLKAGRPGDALQAFEASMSISPNRFNGLYGAAHAAELAGDEETAKAYYSQLLDVASSADEGRAALDEAREFVAEK